VSEPMLQSGMRTSMTGGIAPVMIVYRLTSTAAGYRSGFSSYLQPLGTAQDLEYSWVTPSVITYGPNGGFSRDSSIYNYALFPKGTRTFSARIGVAAGQWTTRVTKRIAFKPGDLENTGRIDPINVVIKLDDRPEMEYRDAKGRWHEEYFLADGKRLGAEDRRIVAVDDTGKTFPLDASEMGGGLRQFGVPMASLAFTPSTDPRFPLQQSVPLARVRELRLETRPFERVEIQNIPLPPQLSPEKPSSH